MRYFHTVINSCLDIYMNKSNAFDARYIWHPHKYSVRVFWLLSFALSYTYVLARREKNFIDFDWYLGKSERYTIKLETRAIFFLIGKYLGMRFTKCHLTSHRRLSLLRHNIPWTINMIINSIFNLDYVLREELINTHVKLVYNILNKVFSCNFTK